MNYDKQKIGDHFIKYCLDFREYGFDFPSAIHVFTEPDLGDPHDHPWDFRSYVINGSYWEEIYALDCEGRIYFLEWKLRKAGDVFEVKAETIHRLVDLPDVRCLTIVVPLEKERRQWRNWKL